MMYYNNDTREWMWEAKDGTETPIKQLEGNHLQNILKWIKRRRGDLKTTLGDGAISWEFYIQSLDKLDKEKDVLEKELARRVYSTEVR